MSEQWFQVEAGRSSVDTERNGSLPDDGSGADHEDIADEGSGPEAEAAAVAVAAAEVRDERSEFVAELVRAVQSTAGAERARIADDVEARRQGLIDGIRARQSAEADRMRALADEDQRAIDAWAEAERQRIEHERERRVLELQNDLTTSLAEHASKIDRQVEAVEAAIETYRAEVEGFFADLDYETDLVSFAQRASRRPIFPDLDAIIAGIADSSAPEEEAEAEEGAAAEAPMIGVMAPEVAASSVEVAQVPVIVEPSTEPIAPEPVTTAAAPSETPTSLFHSLSVSRPGSWLRRDPSADRGHDEEWR